MYLHFIMRSKQGPGLLQKAALCFISALSLNLQTGARVIDPGENAEIDFSVCWSISETSYLLKHVLLFQKKDSED